ncbi:hypothetical protein Vretifemale_5412, partial [Volvox reticuliferus]
FAGARLGLKVVESAPPGAGGGDGEDVVTAGLEATGPKATGGKDRCGGDESRSQMQVADTALWTVREGMFRRARCLLGPGQEEWKGVCGRSNDLRVSPPIWGSKGMARSPCVRSALRAAR